MTKIIIAKIICLFLTWRIILFLVSFLAIYLIPQFGGRFPYYDTELLSTGLPSWIISFGNFDGVHYLRLARMGYEASEFTQAFFPAYPLLIKIISLEKFYFITALVLSNLFFLTSLYLCYKLFKLDYSDKTSWKGIILLLVFPTSFYFGAIYSESMFLFFLLASIYLVRKKHFLGAGLYAALASATRIMGILLIPVVLIEFYLSIRRKEINVKDRSLTNAFIGILLIPVGILLYMLYLNLNFDNPLYFLTAQPFFGAERSQSLVLLPQVLFRYFKIFITVPFVSLASLNALLELIFTIIPLGLLIFAYKKIRFSYWIFILGCLILPTLTGTLSSMPRYALMSFLLFPFIAEKSGRFFRLVVLTAVIFGLLMVILFNRGYWVA